MIHGDTALVAASGDDVAQHDQGSVYVFARQGESWKPQAKLAASDGAWTDFFGVSLALF